MTALVVSGSVAETDHTRFVSSVSHEPNVPEAGPPELSVAKISNELLGPALSGTTHDDSGLEPPKDVADTHVPSLLN